MCGGARWRATGTPKYRMICHCRSCRVCVGSNAVPWATFAAADFELVGDTVQRYASSEGVVRTFCRVCGSSLTYESQTRPGEVDVTQGTLDDPNRLEPVGHIWTEDAAAWEATAHRLPTAAQTGPLSPPHEPAEG